MRQIQPSDVAGTRPGSVYYAYGPATNAYWAMADFDPSKTASLNVQVGFQDGGTNSGIVTLAAGSSVSGVSALVLAVGGAPPQA